MRDQGRYNFAIIRLGRLCAISLRRELQALLSWTDVEVCDRVSRVMPLVPRQTMMCIGQHNDGVIGKHDPQLFSLPPLIISRLVRASGVPAGSVKASGRLGGMVLFNRGFKGLRLLGRFGRRRPETPQKSITVVRFHSLQQHCDATGRCGAGGGQFAGSADVRSFMTYRSGFVTCLDCSVHIVRLTCGLASDTNADVLSLVVLFRLKHPGAASRPEPIYVVLTCRPAQDYSFYASNCSNSPNHPPTRESHDETQERISRLQHLILEPPKTRYFKRLKLPPLYSIPAGGIT
ncbi:hypothetical protein B0H19DRAFT_1167194 [Mycena capillaripes]|nr:hypothetical protein B0H19DRAFT_1167194 [Mycena capillaripes]